MSREQMRDREDRVIAALCTAIELLDGVRAEVLERPDRDHQTGGGCDAILQRLDRRWAVEHTTFDSFLNQRAEDARVERVIGPTGEVLSRAFPNLHISVGLPRDAVVSGSSWGKLAQDLVRELTAEILARQPGPFHGTIHLRGLFPVALVFRISKITGCFFPRVVSEADEKERILTLASALASKSSQLQPYADRGLGTLLLLDNDDIAQLEPTHVARDYKQCVGQYGSPPIEEIWLVDTTEDAPWFVPLKLNDRSVPNLPEFHKFYEARLRATLAKN